MQARGVCSGPRGRATRRESRAEASYSTVTPDEADLVALARCRALELVSRAQKADARHDLDGHLLEHMLPRERVRLGPSSARGDMSRERILTVCRFLGGRLGVEWMLLFFETDLRLLESPPILGSMSSILLSSRTWRLVGGPMSRAPCPPVDSPTDACIVGTASLLCRDSTAGPLPHSYNVLFNKGQPREQRAGARLTPTPPTRLGSKGALIQD